VQYDNDYQESISLVSELTKAVREKREEIEELKAENIKLHKEVSALKSRLRF